MAQGRPRNRAPEGFATVREAATILGISEQAVRARMDRGTLAQRVEPLGNGEIRRYIPREAIDAALQKSHELATRDDAAEIHLAGALLAKETTAELVTEIQRHEAAVTKTIEAQGAALLEQLERGAEERREVTQLIREFAESEKERRAEGDARAREIRWIAYAILALVVVIAVVGAIDVFIVG